MTIEIAAEDHELLQKLLDSGRFSSVSEAVHVGLVQLAQDESPDEEWKRYLDESITAGLADVEADRTRPAAEFLAEMKERYCV